MIFMSRILDMSYVIIVLRTCIRRGAGGLPLRGRDAPHSPVLT